MPDDTSDLLLDISNTPDTPLDLFKAWYAEAQDSVHEASAMTLATVDREGKPSARQVLLKQADESGYVFFTNYHSPKARALDANPWASLLFWWDKLARQVRIEGTVERVGAEESDAYFASRPRDSQIGAWASPQSQIISERRYLLAEIERFNERFAGMPVPRPDYWGGYRVIPQRVEFWQGMTHRLHDRVLYTRDGAVWTKQRMAP